MQEVAEPESTLQVTVLSATLSLAVIVAVWLELEAVGEVRPAIEPVGLLWSTTTVAVCVLVLPAVSVATTVIVCVPAASVPVANDVVQAEAVPESSLQVCDAIATLSDAAIVAVWP